ncbi:hypothetical protein D6T64_06965 [Cryobacterium melibiosiphilum]|uniref:Uncharacterized protein n=1 Tax=Cryobacterium melibiosiphilum TaxID=995039 RepID=A0A3A5MNL8_9MICO|nr:DUF6084 family protein [Cryobacterium melibiosiphilum]RJT88667.1 hypothetical protein D6T64_09930 [Cryobacterium melibiosiphilum]RJT89429.1 hypothetical protein D6T64_06965 [Cryobacterium melibiosiphilum]
MLDLGFSVLDIAAEPYAAAPQLTARLRVTESTGAVVHAIALRSQVRIHPQRRAYDAEEEAGLLDLFGERARWTSTLRSFLWLQCSTTVSGFTGETEVDLPLVCTYDFDVAAAKYLHALRGSTVPLELLFSGSVFTKGAVSMTGATGFAVEQVPWNCEASYALPVLVWRDLMDRYFPNAGWIRLDRDVLGDLAHYKASLGLTSWEAAIATLLAGAQAQDSPSRQHVSGREVRS